MTGDTLDSAISIRTVDIAADGAFSIGTGATLVRDSVPSEEVRETTAKISAVLNSIVQKNRKVSPPVLPAAMKDEEVSEILQKRNQDLSQFWFFYQEKQHARNLKGRTITIIDNEDDFMWMQKHMFTHMGAKVDLVRHDRFRVEDCRSDLIIVGPGPGNPGDSRDPKMTANLAFYDRLMKDRRKFLAICLGHQLLCRKLGFSLLRKKEPSQGVQKRIDLFGEPEIVGFYNTFVGLDDRSVKGVQVCSAGAGKEIYALKGPHFASFQFHPESILTKNGYQILQGALSDLLAR
jgi:phenazine biosynthesis protein phzE